MNVLARSNLMAQFGFDPTLGGMTLPDLTENASRFVSPNNPADAYIFAETNRTVRREAEYGPTSPYVRLNNEAKTVLAAGEPCSFEAESLFQYLGKDGLIDRSVDLRQDLDLRTSHYVAQTLVTHRILSDGGIDHSSVTKSLSVTKHPRGDIPFSDAYYRIHLTGETLRKISAHPHFGFLDYDLGVLAVSFSAFVYLSDSFEDADFVGNDLYYVDPAGRARRMLHPGTRDFNEALGLLYGTSPLPDRLTVVSQPTNLEEPVSFQNRSPIEMTFYRSKWFGQEATHIDLHVTSTQRNKRIVLRNGLRDLVDVLVKLAG